MLLFVFSVITSRRAYIPHLWYSAFFVLLIGACSVAVNGSEVSQSVYSLRLLLRFYIFYLSVTFLSLDDKSMKKVNTFLAFLLLCQLPVVATKFYFYGISEETMGAYSRSGAVTTMLPIMVIFYLAAYYFLYRPKLRYILVGIGFVLFSIVGKKRAVFFLYPLQFLAIYYYIYIKGKGARFSKKVGTLFLVLISILAISGSILHFNKTLNPEGKVGGSVDVGYAIDYAQKYTSNVHPYGYTMGQYSTTIRVIDALWQAGFAKFMFGFGPGSTTRSIFESYESRVRIQRFFDRLNIFYGLTSMSRIALEYGMLGIIAYSSIVFLLSRMCWVYYKHEIDPYWKAFAAGSVGFSFSMLFFFFAYSHGAFWDDTMPLLYFYAMAVVYTRLKRISDHAVRTDSLT